MERKRKGNVVLKTPIVLYEYISYNIVVDPKFWFN